ncbi:MAG: DUF1049 domain-containing protein [Gammaproteobacteria bacterium]|nr:DUF1049 domain-containing protein [Gammaproteobacteria bacterium]
MMKKFMYFFLVVPVVFLGLVFAYWNNQTVTLSFPASNYDVFLPTLLVAVFTLGLIVGYVICFLSSLKVRRKLSVAKKEIRSQENSG